MSGAGLGAMEVGLTRWLRGVRGIELAGRARAEVREDAGPEE
ncbi:hypothetical protein ACIRD3_03690 [Kitasatospora sp. NPDC093550]